VDVIGLKGFLETLHDEHFQILMGLNNAKNAGMKDLRREAQSFFEYLELARSPDDMVQAFSAFYSLIKRRIEREEGVLIREIENWGSGA
jgi:hypothetical protein